MIKAILHFGKLKSYDSETFMKTFILAGRIYKALTEQKDTTECIVAIHEKTGHVVGYLDLKKPSSQLGNDEDPTYQITYMGILDGGKRIGTKMLDSAIVTAKRLGNVKEEQPFTIYHAFKYG
ncbi:Acyl-CoA N-acyltransferase [Sesbania bispinosa]|nr:Acyl-CoA N-acyltransferase [Sesbania bispinosa]